MISDVLAIGCSMLSGAIYTQSIARGESRPSFPSLLMFLLSIAVALYSGYAAGGSLALLPGLGGMLFISISMAVSLKKRVGHFEFGVFDKIGLTLVGLSVAVWAVTREPMVSLITATLIDAIGIFLVILKTLKDRDSESVASWGLAAVGYAIPLFASSDWTFSSCLFSLSNILLCSSISGITLYQRYLSKGFPRRPKVLPRGV